MNVSGIAAIAASNSRRWLLPNMAFDVRRSAGWSSSTDRSIVRSNSRMEPVILTSHAKLLPQIPVLAEMSSVGIAASLLIALALILCAGLGFAALHRGTDAEGEIGIRGLRFRFRLGKSN